MGTRVSATPEQQRQLLGLQRLDSRISQLERRRRERPEQGAVEESAAALRTVAQELTGHVDRLEELRTVAAEATAATAVVTIEEQVDATRRRLEETRDRGQAMAARHRDLQQAAAAAEVARAGELEVAEQERRSAAEAVDPSLRSAYEAARRRLGGLAVVPVVAGGSCGGCRLAIPAMELEAAKELAEEALAECPECGRFLVFEGER